MKFMPKMLLLCLFIISCKMTSNDDVIPKKKENILERTKWKTSGMNAYDPDSILDFHTGNDVTEYMLLSGKEITKHGTYKIRRNAIKIKWGKLTSESVSGVVIGKEMRLEDANGLKTTKYYKIKEY